MRTPQIIRTTTATIGALALLTTLAACSGTSPTEKADAPKPSSTPSASKSSEPQFVDPPADLAKSDVACTDGVASVTLSNQAVSVPDCAKVTIDASNSVVHLGAVEDLVVTGSINDVAAGAVTSITVSGNGNRVTSETAPKPKDDGQQNVFEKR